MTTRGKVFWGIGAAAGVLLGGLWYFQPERLKQAANIRDIPSIRDSVNSVTVRMKQAEGQIQSWASERDGLREQLAKLQGQLKTGWGEQQRQMRHMRDGIMARVHIEMAQQDSNINTRMARFETQREEDRSEMAAMRRQVADLRKSMGRQQTLLAAMESNGSADKELLEQQVASVRESAEEGRGEVRELARSLQPRRIDFELSRNRSQQLAPGVSLCVTKTDVAHRRVNGWMWIMPDRKTIWLRDQGAMQPVIYYSAADGKRRELVITSVTGNGAVGYLLLPAETRQLAMAARPR